MYCHTHAHEEINELNNDRNEYSLNGYTLCIKSLKKLEEEL